MASREALRKTALAALQRWPKDPLRPTAQLQDVLAARLGQDPPRFPGTSGTAEEAGRQVNALVSLLNKRYSSNYLGASGSGASGGLLTPRSNPDYYKDLMRDLEELPTRTWMDRTVLRLKGMFRWS